MGTRVFVRLYDGTTHEESDEEIITLPPSPLTWQNVISTILTAVLKDGKTPDETSIKRARLFLLPSDGTGLAAEVCS
jgi:hypothetical protein